MLEPDETIASRRLSELRAAQPGDPTLRNLLGVIAAKLELSARLPIYEYEAGSQGHAASSAAFHRLADAERRSFEDLLSALRQHLDHISAAETAAASSPTEGTPA